MVGEPVSPAAAKYARQDACDVDRLACKLANGANHYVGKILRDTILEGESSPSSAKKSGDDSARGHARDASEARQISQLVQPLYRGLSE